MKIAILEICASTHYTLTNALIKTYSTDPNNQIVVYTTEFIGKVIKEGGISKQTSLVIFDTTKKVGDFLKDIENTPFDRLHICTVSPNFKQFKQFKPNVKSLFSIFTTLICGLTPVLSIVLKMPFTISKTIPIKCVK